MDRMSLFKKISDLADNHSLSNPEGNSPGHHGVGRALHEAALAVGLHSGLNAGDEILQHHSEMASAHEKRMGLREVGDDSDDLIGK